MNSYIYRYWRSRDSIFYVQLLAAVCDIKISHVISSHWTWWTRKLNIFYLKTKSESFAINLPQMKMNFLILSKLACRYFFAWDYIISQLRLLQYPQTSWRRVCSWYLLHEYWTNSSSVLRIFVIWQTHLFQPKFICLFKVVRYQVFWKAYNLFYL